MTRLEVEILLPIIVQEIFELWRGNKITQGLVIGICHQIEERIQSMVDKGDVHHTSTRHPEGFNA